ncbi:MAG: hypothetical protein ABF633_12995 [Clostridium sp.]|uniref:hypothetical protein n=1 Tax=Clostridium sp. TaxID=1506 RepID=UPI0039ECA7B6
MRGKTYNIFMVLVVIGVILGLCINNIVLNRTIYSNEIHMKASEETYRNKINKYNLDDMEKKLDMLEDKMNNPEKYEKDDSDIVFKVYVPRFRILFSMDPLDLRFETQNYKVYLNNSIIGKIKNQIAYVSNMWQKLISKVTYNLSSSNDKLNNITSKIAALKTKIYYSIIK